MNKKLLGIAAVALLGVSAAFAATTSTVYFTASGTLTKQEASGVGVIAYSDLLPKNDNDDNDNFQYVIKKYQGKEIIDSAGTSKACTVTLDDSTKVDNPNETFKKNYPYIYSNVTISNLEFEKSGDYIVIPFCLASKNSNAYYYNFANSISCYFKGTANNSNTTIYGYSDLTVSGDDASLFTVRFGDSNIYMLDPDITTKTTSDGTYTYSSTSEICSINTSVGFAYFYVSIQLKEDVTTAKKFSSLSFSLPEFSKVTE